MSNAGRESDLAVRRAEETRAHLAKELSALRRRSASLERRTKRQLTIALIGVGVIVMCVAVATWLRRR